MTSNSLRRVGATVLGLALLSGSALGEDCIQNPDFDLGPTGWTLNQGGLSGTARALGGFLELSVSFPSDFAEARQTCTSSNFERTVSVDVSDGGLGTVNFLMGWGAADGTNADLERITEAGRPSVTTTDPSRDTIIFRADAMVHGASAQALDNVEVNCVPVEDVTSGLTNFLLTGQDEPDRSDRNSDGQVDVADIVTVINEATP